MNGVFSINIGTREITLSPDQGEHLVGGYVVGCFKLTEGDTLQGSICFNESSWEYDEQGNLTTADMEAIADEIIFAYKEEELEGGYVEYAEDKISIYNADEQLTALIEYQDEQWVQTIGEKLSDETIAAYVKGMDDF